jgi:hypothetical protein
MDTPARHLDRPAAVLGLVMTAVSWWVGVTPLTAIAIGGVTVGVATAGVALTRRRAASREAADGSSLGPSVPLSAREEGWIRRGNGAVSTIEHGVWSLAGGALREGLLPVAAQARDALEDLRTLGTQAAATRAAGHRLDASRLTSDLTRLTTKLEQGSGPDVEEDLRRSVEAVREQLSVHRRLETARRVLQARIESGSLGLQQLAAQVSEMTALASPDTFAQQGMRIDELNAQLEALRSGLNDAGSLSRRALGEIDTGGGRDDPAVP